MKQYKVIVQEIVCGVFTINANSPDEAFQLASQKYKDGELVNEPGECQNSQIAIYDKFGHALIDFAEV